MFREDDCPAWEIGDEVKETLNYFFGGDAANNTQQAADIAAMEEHAEWRLSTAWTAADRHPCPAEDLGYEGQELTVEQIEDGSMQMKIVPAEKVYAPPSRYIEAHMEDVIISLEKWA